jgi:hypothetical protein
MFHVRTASEWNMISRIGNTEVQSEKALQFYGFLNFVCRYLAGTLERRFGSS